MTIPVLTMEKIKILWNCKEYNTVPYFNNDEIMRLLEENMINYDICERFPNGSGSCAYIYPDHTIQAITEYVNQ